MHHHEKLAHAPNREFPLVTAVDELEADDAPH